MVSPTKAEKKAYAFPHSKDAWTKKTVEYSWFAAMTVKTTIVPALGLFIEPKVSRESWKEIQEINLETIKTVGEIEQITVKILKREMTAENKRKKEVHLKVQRTLKTFAKKGLLGAIPTILDIIKNP